MRVSKTLTAGILSTAAVPAEVFRQTENARFFFDRASRYNHVKKNRLVVCYVLPLLSGFLFTPALATRS